MSIMPSSLSFKQGSRLIHAAIFEKNVPVSSSKRVSRQSAANRETQSRTIAIFPEQTAAAEKKRAALPAWLGSNRRRSPRRRLRDGTWLGHTGKRHVSLGHEAHLLRCNIKSPITGCPSWTLIEPCASRRSLILGASWKTFWRCGWPHRIKA
jgi:hypothetical protein